MLDALVNQLTRGESLSREQVPAAICDLIEPGLSAELKADFLTAFAKKGETTDEIAAFANEFRLRSIQPPIDLETRQREILDVCGTGGDCLNTFNISTTVAFIAAAAGVPVAKHGNRAITSQTGSADVLEALGVPIDLTPEDAGHSLQEHGFAFFFAPKYHPVFQHLGPARKLCALRGQRTIFNILGPLLNPARPTVQLVGVPNARLCEPIARVLQCLGTRRAMVVSGRVGEACLDELSGLGENTIAEFYHDRGFTVSVCQPDDFPFQPVTLEDLRGGTREANAEIIKRILSGRERGAKRDAVLFNAGAALLVAGKVKSIAEGWEMATETIDSGSAAARLEALATSKQ